jgi:hypothetical protein
VFPGRSACTFQKAVINEIPYVIFNKVSSQSFEQVLVVFIY